MLTAKVAKAKKAGEPKPGVATRDIERATPELNPLWQSFAIGHPPLQTKPAVSQPDDPYPRDPDQGLSRIATESALPDAAPQRTGIVLQGLGGSGSPLPHLDLIQSSFGHHDVSGVRTHMGSEASEANRKLDAEAYTCGDQIAFARTPSLHTAAHEAAHVVQQRSGVHLKNNVGEAGDAYEKHADAVANLVVMGVPVEPLLDRMAESTASHSTGAPGTGVMRKAGPAVQMQQESKSVTAREFPEIPGLRDKISGWISIHGIKSAMMRTLANEYVNWKKAAAEIFRPTPQIKDWIPPSTNEPSEEQVFNALMSESDLKKTGKGDKATDWSFEWVEEPNAQREKTGVEQFSESLKFGLEKWKDKKIDNKYAAPDAGKYPIEKRYVTKQHTWGAQQKGKANLAFLLAESVVTGELPSGMSVVDAISEPVARWTMKNVLKVSAEVASRTIPIIGFIFLAYDVLDLLISLNSSVKKELSPSRQARLDIVADVRAYLEMKAAAAAADLENKKAAAQLQDDVNKQFDPNKFVKPLSSDRLQRKAEPESNRLWPSLVLRPAAIQPKLTVSQPDDPYELEADSIAAKVMRMAIPGAVDVGPPSTGATYPEVLRACDHCEEEEEELQRSSDGQTVGVAQAAPAVVREALKSGGLPLEPELRVFFEPRFGRDLSTVRVHTDALADQSSRAVNAHAYTVGEHIAFRSGQYSPVSETGRRLMAHELVHVVQQGAAGDAPLQNVTAANPPSGTASQPNVTPQCSSPSIAFRVATERVQREGPDDPTGTPCPLPADMLQLLQEYGIDLSDEDQCWLAQNYSSGFGLERTVVDILTIGGSRANGYKLRGVQVTPPAPLQPAVQAWIFHVDKGRAILVSSTRTGESVQLDMGSGGTGGAPRLVTALERIVGSGLAQAPERTILSHTDEDHLRACRQFFGAAAFSETALQIAAEQLNSVVGRRDWRNMGLTLLPSQQLIQIQVTGGAGAVHENRLVYDGFTMTEYRSVAAHQTLATATRNFDKNRTSPVTIVTDLVTGERMLYTADGTGHLFNDVINAVGEQGFVRLLGGAGSGGGLKTVEYPHHGGAVTGGPSVAGVLRMLRLSFEASNGTVNFITQTSNSFAGGASASIRFLDLAGVEVERITGGTPTAGTSEVTRIRGAVKQTVSIDLTGIRSVLTAAQANETAIMAGYQRLYELRLLQERASTLHEGLTYAGAPKTLLESVAQMRTELSANETSLKTAAGRVWSEMETAANAAGGMRSTASMTRVATELTALTAEVGRTNPTVARNSLEAHESNLNAYGSVFVTLTRMLSALHGERYEELSQLQSRYRALIVEAQAMLGPAEVYDHVRSSWAATRAEWTPERLRQAASTLGSLAAAQRAMMTQYRADLLESLGRQMQLNRMAEEAMSGRQVYGPGGVPTTPVGTRVGAGILAAIELLRIGLELGVQYKEASAAAEAQATRDRLEGLHTVFWWAEQGVTPILALVQRNFWGNRVVVSNEMTQDEILAVARGRAPENTPEHDMVVVTDVSDRDLLFMIGNLYFTTFTLADWIRENNRNPSGETFRKFDDGWGVRLWDSEDGRYIYWIKEAIQTPLDALHTNLEAGQTELLQHRAEEAGETSTIADSAWVFGQDRVCYVYNSYGNVRELDFDDVHPRFVRYGTAWLFGEEMVVVQAVDMPTFRRLSEHYWRVVTGTWIGASGGGETYDVFRNRQGLAMVSADNLVAE